MANAEHHVSTAGRYLKDAVYGASDGIVTTFAVVAGVAGAALAPEVVLILGFANLLADGFSMAAGSYSATRSEREYYESMRERESSDIEKDPAGEREQVRVVVRKKGFPEDLTDKIVRHLTSDKKLWVDTVMREQYGEPLDDGKPFRHAFATFAAFVVAGFMPLLAYVLARFIPGLSPVMFSIAIVVTALALIVVGVLKSRVTLRPAWREALQMLLVGGFAAGMAYVVGLSIGLLVS